VLRSVLAEPHVLGLLERYFLNVPGLKVVCPSTPADAKGLLKSAIRDENPVIFIESESLYSIKGEVSEDPVRRQGRDVTVVAYIGMVHCAMEAAEELEKDSRRLSGVSCWVQRYINSLMRACAMSEATPSGRCASGPPSARTGSS